MHVNLRLVKALVEGDEARATAPSSDVFTHLGEFLDADDVLERHEVNTAHEAPHVVHAVLLSPWRRRDHQRPPVLRHETPSLDGVLFGKFINGSAELAHSGELPGEERHLRPEVVAILDDFLLQLLAVGVVQESIHLAPVSEPFLQS